MTTVHRVNNLQFLIVCVRFFTVLFDMILAVFSVVKVHYMWFLSVCYYVLLSFCNVRGLLIFIQRSASDSFSLTSKFAYWISNCFAAVWRNRPCILLQSLSKIDTSWPKLLREEKLSRVCLYVHLSISIIVNHL